uniref:Uncharacterized protein n=1 Tax=Arundo donax TaxID=35708 RepID=A0A0A9ELZ3_ARUDO
MNRTTRNTINIICPLMPAFFITMDTLFCTKSSLFEVVSISKLRSFKILSCKTVVYARYLASFCNAVYSKGKKNAENMTRKCT